LAIDHIELLIPDILAKKETPGRPRELLHDSAERHTIN
jgi:hypothetical protein